MLRPLVKIERQDLGTTSTSEMEPAILMLPVISQLRTNVSMLPVMRRPTALAGLESGGARHWSKRIW
jgi:hypothetical protein